MRCESEWRRMEAACDHSLQTQSTTFRTALSGLVSRSDLHQVMERGCVVWNQAAEAVLHDLSSRTHLGVGSDVLKHK